MSEEEQAVIAGRAVLAHREAKRDRALLRLEAQRIGRQLGLVAQAFIHQRQAPVEPEIREACDAEMVLSLLRQIEEAETRYTNLRGCLRELGLTEL